MPWLLLVASAVATLAFEAAWGHAIVVAARPPMNATVAPGVHDVVLQFNSRIDRRRSRLVVRAPDGTETAVALVADAPPDTLAGRADLRATGAWKLGWQVLSLDGHVTRGEVRFSVRETAARP
jgi:methionine-rich copper-binding protein CopC